MKSEEGQGVGYGGYEGADDEERFELEGPDV